MPEELPPRGPDRLVVRKDAHRELEFRYSREERLARGTAPRRAEANASRIKGRTLRILLLNVVLLAALAFAAARLLAAPGNRARIGPFTASLESLVYESTVYVTVTLRFTGRAGVEVPVERLAARLTLEPGGEGVRKQAALPRAPGEEVTVGEAFALAEAVRVRADLEIGPWTRVLSRDLAR